MAEQELLILTPALAAIDLDLHLDDHRGIGDPMAPYSSARAYQWHMERRPREPFTQLIWANAATPRCKHFLWLLYRERLPSAALLFRRNITDHDLCAYCSAPEDQDHIMLRCPRAKRVWRLLNFPSAPHLTSFRELWTLPDLPLNDERATSTVLTAITWNIWKARNSFQFEGTLTTSEQVLHAIHDDLQLWVHRVPQRHRSEFLGVVSILFNS